jgi:hypothetical protein
MEEVKRCELKLPVEIKRTARIHCRGRVPTGAIASRNPVEGDKVPTPVRRSARIQGMKWKDYMEVSPEHKDYGGSDYSDDRSPSSWAAAGRDDNDLYIWDEVPKEKTPEGPNGGGDDGGCRMDLPGPTTSVGTRTDYLVGPWDYPTCAARHCRCFRPATY